MWGFERFFLIQINRFLKFVQILGLNHQIDWHKWPTKGRAR